MAGRDGCLDPPPLRRDDSCRRNRDGRLVCTAEEDHFLDHFCPGGTAPAGGFELVARSNHVPSSVEARPYAYLPARRATRKESYQDCYSKKRLQGWWGARFSSQGKMLAPRRRAAGPWSDPNWPLHRALHPTTAVTASPVNRAL